MTTYSVRCRNSACRHRRVISRHPDEYRLVPKCGSCGKRAGWRIEQRYFNLRNRCRCSGYHYPHAAGSPLCDSNPRGFYNQAKRAGVHDDDIPVEYLEPCGEVCPF